MHNPDMLNDEGPGTGEAHAHYVNLMNPEYTRLGVRRIEVGGTLPHP
jgi:hypothetical protein